ncbi:hypothetical protein D9758_010019 [Tetrapyrgos nigripes]|uniref:Uncharacterized protein n=1 Tax=Tetrapyrgos nigripes TaxID=182062 RepID=A0A8H5CU76_9AGAR|nr:hypothetical protein D9758_010019 [Tetrapyrgos nigripes]
MGQNNPPLPHWPRLARIRESKLDYRLEYGDVWRFLRHPLSTLSSNLMKTTTYSGRSMSDGDGKVEGVQGEARGQTQASRLAYILFGSDWELALVMGDGDKGDSTIGHCRTRLHLLSTNRHGCQRRKPTTAPTSLTNPSTSAPTSTLTPYPSSSTSMSESGQLLDGDILKDMHKDTNSDKDTDLLSPTTILSGHVSRHTRREEVNVSPSPVSLDTSSPNEGRLWLQSR